MDNTRIQIQLPWAHIQGTTFGDASDGQPVLYLYESNMPKDLQELFAARNGNFYVCVDFDKVAMSWPAYSNPFALDYLLAIRCILDSLNVHLIKRYEKWMLVANGFPGELSILFGQIYFSYLTKIIVIDAVYVPLEDPHCLRDKLIALYASNLESTSSKRKNKPLVLPMFTMEYLNDLFTHQHVPFDLPVHMLFSTRKCFTRYEECVLEIVKGFHNVQIAFVHDGDLRDKIHSVVYERKLVDSKL